MTVLDDWQVSYGAFGPDPANGGAKFGSMMFDRDAITALLPHGPTMVMLDSAHTAEAGVLIAKSDQHTNANNPLRIEGGLPASAALEFAAQAIALHGATAKGKPAEHSGDRLAFIASFKKAVWAAENLDQAPGPLSIRAEKVTELGDGAQYRFAVTDDDGNMRAEGEALVMFRPAS